MKKYITPLIIFVLLGLLLAYGLNLDPRRIPSPLIGKSLPAFSLTTVADPAHKVSRDELQGRAYLRYPVSA
jgi:cytochrome c biogenesis protein CcmG/thiol:disulfide interchange protein DsbE